MQLVYVHACCCVCNVLEHAACSKDARLSRVESSQLSAAVLGGMAVAYLHTRLSFPLACVLPRLPSHIRGKQARGAVLCMLTSNSACACCDSTRRSRGERQTITLSTTRIAAVHLPIDVSCLSKVGAYLQTTLARTYSHSAPLSHLILHRLSAPHTVPSTPPPSVPTSLSSR
jgi:hypothetical protein